MGVYIEIPRLISTFLTNPFQRAKFPILLSFFSSSLLHFPFPHPSPRPSLLALLSSPFSHSLSSPLTPHPLILLSLPQEKREGEKKSRKKEKGKRKKEKRKREKGKGKREKGKEKKVRIPPIKQTLSWKNPAVLGCTRPYYFCTLHGHTRLIRIEASIR